MGNFDGAEPQRCVSVFFFPRDRALDASRVHRQAQLLVHQLRQGARLDRTGAAVVLIDDAHHLGRELVGRLRSTGLEQQPAEPVTRIGGLGQIEGRPGQAEQAGRLGLGDAVLARMTKHLVLDLDEVVGVEEAGAVEPCRTHLLRPRVQRPELAQAIGLGRVLSHRDARDLSVMYYTPHILIFQAPVAGHELKSA